MFNLNEDKILIIGEIANNHNGDINKGIEIITQFSKVFKKYPIFQYGFKLQYRDLDSFIHPDYEKDYSFKYIKRFKSTELTEDGFLKMKNKIKEYDYLSICTPFDENSVRKIIDHKFDVIKIASCSLTDWELLEEIVITNFSIIASTAGASEKDMDKVYSFFKNRKKQFNFLHCISEYPAQDSRLQLNQIDFLKKKFPDILIGYSSHANPSNTDVIKVAVSKGAKIIEVHIDLDCNTINEYSYTPVKMDKMLQSVKNVIEMCGIKNQRYNLLKEEKKSLRNLRRAIWLKKDLKKNDKIKLGDINLYIPTLSDMHITINDFSKYKDFILKKDVSKNSPVFFDDVDIIDNRNIVLDIIKKTKDLILKSKISLPEKVEIEISHHLGINNFWQYGAIILNCINTENYAKKLLIIFPQQIHPIHHHIKKTESFFILHGTLNLILFDKNSVYNDQIDQIIFRTKDVLLKTGDTYTIEKEIPHQFSSDNGCVFEEISTTQYSNDSFYIDNKIMNNYTDRKTNMTFRSKWLLEELK